MNLIANCCFGADYYGMKNIPYNNPFMWCIIEPNDFLKLMESYDSLNFENFELVTKDLRNIELHDIPEREHALGIKIDGQISVWYVHYIFDPNINGIKKIGSDVRGNKIFNYVIEKYKARLVRFKELNEEPTFIFISGNRKHEEELDMLKLMEKIPKNLKYKLIVFTSYKSLTKFATDKIQIHVYDQNLLNLPITLARFLDKNKTIDPIIQ